MVSLTRIRALALQDFYITHREVTIWVDLSFFSAINVLLFGYIARYLAGNSNGVSRSLVVGVVMWEVIRSCQYTVTINSMWNLWSHNLANMFIAPVSIGEYVTGSIATAMIKTVCLLIPIVLATKAVFGFGMWEVGTLNFILAVVSLMIFAGAVGLVLLGLVFRYGPRVQAISWSAVYLFQPLVGVFFPTDILPRPFQLLADIVPATWAFNGIHNALTGSGPTVQLQLISIAMSVVALALGIWFFRTFYHLAKVSGQFARNDI